MSAAELTIVSLPDEMLLLVIRACNEPIRVSNGLPLFEHVKGLACLSKALQQQLHLKLHRLQPLVPDKVLLHTGHSSNLLVHNSQAAQETRQVSTAFQHVKRQVPHGAPANKPPPKGQRNTPTSCAWPRPDCGTGPRA